MTRHELIASYLAALPEADAEGAADRFATGQTLGTWRRVPGITARRRRDHGGRVAELRRTEPDEHIAGERTEGRWLLRVAFPTVNFGPAFPMIFSTLLGNDTSTSLPVRLVDVELPASLVRLLPGPRYGMPGWRELTGVHDRPLLLNMIKPNTGFSPAAGARFVAASAAGGTDLIKDDELLADPPFNRAAERARAYRRALDGVADRTGRRARYIANVTTRSCQLVDLAWAVVDAGADALMVNALALGLDGLQTLAESAPAVPILAHTAGVEIFTGGGSSGFGQAVLLGRLLPLAGADAVLTSTPYATRPLDRPTYEATIRTLAAGQAPPPVAPFVGGGLTPDHVPALIDDLGLDALVGMGGAIQGHPRGATVGARQAVRALELAARRWRQRKASAA